MPRRSLDTAASKFAAGSLLGYKGAQPGEFPVITYAAPAAPVSAIPCIPGTYVDFTDDFNRADGPLGAPWTVQNIATPGVQIVGGVARFPAPEGGSPGASIVTLDAVPYFGTAWGLRQSIELTVGDWNQSGFSDITNPLMLRCGAGGGFGYVDLFHPSSSNLWALAWTDGFTHFPVNATVPFPAIGDRVRLEQTFDGSVATLNAYLNGVLRATTSTSAGWFTPTTTGPGPGWRQYNNTNYGGTASVDNVRVVGTTAC